MLAAMPPNAANNADYAARIAFVVELAERLHSYGTTAQRLEGAVMAVATELGLDCEPMSNPTGMTLSFSDPRRPPGETDTTRVIRMPPGDTDLAKLVEADRIAEEVMAGRLGIAEASHATAGRWRLHGISTGHGGTVCSPQPRRLPSHERQHRTEHPLR